MSELIYCPECGHPKWDKDHSDCTYESIAGEASTPSELQLLVIDLGDSCVVRMEKGTLDVLDPSDMHQMDGGVYAINMPFPQLRSAIDGEKPVPRIEQHPQIEERYYLHYFGDGNGCMPLNAQQYDDLTKINGGVPLKVYESAGKWEELIGLQKEGDVGWIDARILTIWRYKR